MSAWSDFFTQPGFWIGTPVGTVVGGLGGAWISARRSKASDAFKARQEDKTNSEKRAHDEKVEREKRAYEACTEFYTLATEVLTKAVDIKGTFNAIRDAFYNASGDADPMVDAKIEFATGQTEALLPLGQVLNRVKFNAPKEIVSYAAQLYQSLAAIVQTTTEPAAKVVTMKSAGLQLDAFINAYRTFYGLETYSVDDAKKDTATYLETLQAQASAFLEEAESEIRTASTAQPDREEFEADLIGGPSKRGSVSRTTLTAASLNQSYIGKFFGRAEGGHNRLGKIVELIPVLSDPDGMWLATVHWGETPTAAATIERMKLPFSHPVEIIEIEPQ